MILKKLFAIYDEVSKPKQVKEDMVSSLETILKSLERIESEVANRKTEEISKRKKIIEAR